MEALARVLSTTGKSIAQLEKIDLEPSYSFLEPSASYAFLYNQSGMEQIETAENNLTSIRFWVDNFQNVQQPPLVVNDKWLARTHAGEQTAVSKHLMTKLVLCCGKLMK